LCPRLTEKVAFLVHATGPIIYQNLFKIPTYAMKHFNDTQSCVPFCKSSSRVTDKGKKKLKAVIRANMDAALSSSGNLPDTSQYEKTCLKKLRCSNAASKLF
jgi:hypothetical protein